jgi:hypothetical protein
VYQLPQTPPEDGAADAVDKAVFFASVEARTVLGKNAPWRYHTALSSKVAG